MFYIDVSLLFFWAIQRIFQLAIKNNNVYKVLHLSMVCMVVEKEHCSFQVFVLELS